MAAKTIPVFILLGIGLLSISISIIGCSSKEDHKIEFETIDQREWPGTGHDYPGADLQLIIIPTANEIQDVDEWISEDAKSELKELDYSNFFALVVFQGLKPTNRYGIEINSLSRKNNNVLVEITLTERDPNLEAADVQTSPYHLIRIIKNGDWNEDINFNVITNGTILISTSQFIP